MRRLGFGEDDRRSKSAIGYGNCGHPGPISGTGQADQVWHDGVGIAGRRIDNHSVLRIAERMHIR
jgi:hypothetical protein